VAIGETTRSEVRVTTNRRKSETDIHLLGTQEKDQLLLLGTDDLGRDMLSRILYASRISLSIGFVGVGISFVLGSILGGISGYFGGVSDLIIQRVIEVLLSIPTIPLWMALSAALPPQWAPIKIYFGITIVLSFVGWTSLARVVRGKFLELREADFVMAAQLAGANEGRIIARHLLPAFSSYLIVNLTLAIPNMILGETSLSFLGLGLRPPIVSWGVLLKNAQNLRTLALYPWLLLPAAFVIVTVLTFNFIGDGLRDAVDPYKRA
jgi:peptide/nickel transport system permease protein